MHYAVWETSSTHHAAIAAEYLFPSRSKLTMSMAFTSSNDQQCVQKMFHWTKDNGLLLLTHIFRVRYEESGKLHMGSAHQSDSWYFAIRRVNVLAQEEGTAHPIFQ